MDGIYDLYPLVIQRKVRLVGKIHLVLMYNMQLRLMLMFNLSFPILCPLLMMTSMIPYDMPMLSTSTLQVDKSLTYTSIGLILDRRNCWRTLTLMLGCSDLEMQWVAVSINNVRPITVVNIYRPPQGDYKNACKLINEAFEKDNMKDNTDVFVPGDFNINFGNTSSRLFKELDFTMKSLRMTQFIREPTKISFRNGEDTSTILDLIFTNTESVLGAGLLDLNISDHMGVSVIRKKINVKPNKIEFKGRSYKNYVKEDFQDMLVQELGGLLQD